MIIGTNYIGQFLLTHLLSDLMRKSAPACIINVSSSDRARVSKLDLSFCTTTPSNSLWPFQYYSVSKLFLLLHAKELGKRLKGNIYYNSLKSLKMSKDGVMESTFRPLLNQLDSFQAWVKNMLEPHTQKNILLHDSVHSMGYTSIRNEKYFLINIWSDGN